MELDFVVPTVIIFYTAENENKKKVIVLVEECRVGKVVVNKKWDLHSADRR